MLPNVACFPSRSVRESALRKFLLTKTRIILIELKRYIQKNKQDRKIFKYNIVSTNLKFKGV